MRAFAEPFAREWAAPLGAPRGGGAVVAAFTPLDLPSIALFTRPEAPPTGSPYTDTARTTAVASDGDAVAGYANLVGAPHFVQATAGSRPLWQTAELNGKPLLQVTGGRHLAAVGGGASGIALGTAHTIHALFRRTAGDGVLLGTVTPYYCLYFDGAGLYYNVGGNQVSVAHPLTVGTAYTVTIWRDGTSVKFYVNGSQIGATQTLAGNGSDTFNAIGSYTGGGAPANGHVGPVLLATAAHGAGDLASAWDWLKAWGGHY